MTRVGVAFSSIRAGRSLHAVGVALRVLRTVARRVCVSSRSSPCHIYPTADKDVEVQAADDVLDDQVGGRYDSISVAAVIPVDGEACTVSPVDAHWRNDGAGEPK